MINYTEREGRYDWSPEVQQALAFAAKCIGLKQALALHPGHAADNGGSLLADSSSPLHELIRQPGFVGASRAAVTACILEVEREVWQEIQLLGRTADQLACSGDSRPGSAYCGPSTTQGPLPAAQLEVILTLLVTRPARWSALMLLLSNFMGTFCLALVESEALEALQQLQSAIKTLADAWCQALSDVSALLAGRLPNSPQQEQQWMQLMLQYSDAGRLHKVWSLSHGAWAQSNKRLGERPDDSQLLSNRRRSSAFPALGRGGPASWSQGARPASAVAPSARGQSGPRPGSSGMPSSVSTAMKSRGAGQSGWLALIGPMPGIPATGLVEAHACSAAAVAVATAAEAATASDAGGGGSGVGAVICCGTTPLSLQGSDLQAVLLSTSAERAHRLASSPVLLLLPAADICQAAPAPAAVGSINISALRPASRMTTPVLDGGRTPAASGNAVAAAEASESGLITVPLRKAPCEVGDSNADPQPPASLDARGPKEGSGPHKLVGKPPLPGGGGPSDLTVTKRLQSAGAGGGANGRAALVHSDHRPVLAVSGSSSLLVLQLALFLSQVRRQVACLGVSVNVELVSVTASSPEHTAETEVQRKWQLHAVISRPISSQLLQQAGVHLGFGSPSHGPGHAAGGAPVAGLGTAAEHASNGALWLPAQPPLLTPLKEAGSGQQPSSGAVAASTLTAAAGSLPPPVSALASAAAASGQQLLQQAVAAVLAVLEVTNKPAGSTAGRATPPSSQTQLVSWPAASLLVLLASCAPHPGSGKGAGPSTPAGAPALQPAVVAALMDVVHATLLTSQALCCQVSHLPLLYPKDARTDDMCRAHSRGLALFECLHRLMDCCMQLLKQQWQMGVVERATGLMTVGGDPPASASLAARRASMERAGSKGSARFMATEEDGSNSATARNGTPMLQRRNSEGSASGSFSGTMSKIKSVFRGSKVQPTGNRTSLDASGRNGARPSVDLGSGKRASFDTGSRNAARSSADVGGRSAMQPGSAAAPRLSPGPLGMRSGVGDDSAMETQTASTVGLQLQRKIALQMSWSQLLVMERVRSTLMQLRGAMADIGKALLDAFAQGARDSYKLVPHTDWVTPRGNGAAGEGGKPTPGAQRVLQGLLAPLRDCLLVDDLHPQSRAFLLSGAVSSVLTMIDEQVEQAVKKAKVSTPVVKAGLACQLALDLGVLLTELQQYQPETASAEAWEEGNERAAGCIAGAEVTGKPSLHWGLGPTIETLQRQIAAVEAHWTAP